MRAYVPATQLPSSRSVKRDKSRISGYAWVYNDQWGRRVTRDAAVARQNTTTTRIPARMTFADGALIPLALIVELDAMYSRSQRKGSVQSRGIKFSKRHTLRSGDGDILGTEDRRNTVHSTYLHRRVSAPSLMTVHGYYKRLTRIILDRVLQLHSYDQTQRNARSLTRSRSGRGNEMTEVSSISSACSLSVYTTPSCPIVRHALSSEDGLLCLRSSTEDVGPRVSVLPANLIEICSHISTRLQISILFLSTQVSIP